MSSADGYEALSQRHAALRDLDRIRSRKFGWASLSEFLAAASYGDGIHSIALVDVILDIHVEIKVGAAALIYLHENCPRSSAFKLPVFSGAYVTSHLNVTRIAPCDPSLLLDSGLELAWHCGNAENDLQSIYKKVFRRLVEYAEASRVIFWGGSGGGFASLYYSYFFPGSVAVVWNPQTSIGRYFDGAVRKYLNVAFGQEGGPGSVVSGMMPAHLCHDLGKLYSYRASNTVVYIQSIDDWHADEHLMPLLNAMDKAQAQYVEAVKGSGGVHSGWLRDNFYLYLGVVANGHNPPSRQEISLLLEAVVCDWDGFGSEGFPAVRDKQERRTYLPPSFARDIAKGRQKFVREDWLPAAKAPAVDFQRPQDLILVDGTRITPDASGYPWGTALSGRNPYSLYSLGHVGRLASVENGPAADIFLEVAKDISTSFLDYISIPDNYFEVLKNRGYSSGDHSMSIRSNALVKLLSRMTDHPRDQILSERIVRHLLQLGDFFSNPANIYPSNHGMMCCVSLAQIGLQFKARPLFYRKFTEAAADNFLRLISKSLDEDGLCDENTIGYHSFILRLIDEFLEYWENNEVDLAQLALVRKKRDLAWRALRICVRPDGSIPPIGDSPLYRQKIPSINESYLFAHSGFAVVKSDESYLSFIAGARSENHKQCDDLSITLQFEGEEIVVDGGSYTYDKRSVHRLFLESFSGHSGPCFESLRSVSPKEYWVRHRVGAAIDRFDVNNASAIIAGHVEVKYGVTRAVVRRDIIYSDWRTLVIKDEFDVRQGPAEVLGDCWLSFLMGPQLVLVVQTKQGLLLKGKAVAVVLVSLSGAVIDVFRGIDGASKSDVLGWCSENWQEILPTNQVLMKVQLPTNRLVSGLKLFKLDGLPEDCHALIASVHEELSGALVPS